MTETLARLIPVLVVMVALFALLALYAFKKYKVYQQGGWEAVINSIQADAYAAMLWAERNFSDDEGGTKFLVVLEETYYLLPEEVRKYISKEAYAVILQDWYDNAKDILDDGALNRSQDIVQRK